MNVFTSSDVGPRTLIVFSGGFDSTSLLLEEYTHTQNPTKRIAALTFNYGQRHHKEIQVAQNICKSLNVPHIILDISNHIFDASLSALMQNSQDAIHHKCYTQFGAAERDRFGAVNTSVPLRNPLFAIIAAIKAAELHCDYVKLAVHMGDCADYAYPDCSPNCLLPLNQAVAAATNNLIRLSFPFLYITKAQIAKRCATDPNMSRLWHTIIGRSWSCYEGGELHCGQCATCLERRAAFVSAGLVDPTKYVK